ncbi:hypothetical protein ARSQ2_00538 [Arsenophonus endosymbiont of Bemisia tabaci Q2]|nr:hypothetical protein ARSQ2_00538 [Arsenophonus endosymbiont of Bemisia tabaci Q2]
MKVVFHTILRGLTAIPRKVNGVLVSRTRELKEEQMLSALYWGQRCLLSDYLISILTGMFSMPGVTQVLIPVLPKNSVIMMDNTTFHKKQSIQQVHHRCGAYGGIFSYLFARS